MKQNRNFLILGITGGAGSGKTTIVEKLEGMAPTVFLHCDVIAHELMQPGGPSYDALVKEYGTGILEEKQGTKENGATTMSPISRQKLAAVAMATGESRKRLNELTHPLVQNAVEEELERLREEEFRGVVIIEAALLIEAGYKELCDSLWYVYAPLADRIRRMKEKRGYTEEKIANILAGQLTEDEFRAHADVVIENPDCTEYKTDDTVEKQIQQHLKECMEKTDKMW